jgi:hypothetical protein
LGSGEFGIVIRGIAKGLPVAAKTVKKDSDVSCLRSLLSELKIMVRSLDHGIVRHLNFNQWEEKVQK